MNAFITVRFRANDVCHPVDLAESKMTLREMVEYLVKEEGLFGIVEDEGEVIDVVEAL